MKNRLLLACLGTSLLFLYSCSDNPTNPHVDKRLEGVWQSPGTEYRITGDSISMIIGSVLLGGRYAAIQDSILILRSFTGSSAEYGGSGGFRYHLAGDSLILYRMTEDLTWCEKRSNTLYAVHQTILGSAMVEEKKLQFSDANSGYFIRSVTLGSSAPLKDSLPFSILDENRVSIDNLIHPMRRYGSDWIALNLDRDNLFVDTDTTILIRQ